MKIAKELKKKGKVSIDGPKVKERKRSAPPSKAHKPKKGKGSYTREEKQVLENTIQKFIDALLEENHSDAHKYLSQAVELKLQFRMKDAMSTPIFH